MLKKSTDLYRSAKDGSNAFKDLKNKIALAKGQKKVDLVVRNAKIVNMFSGEIYQTDVAVANGIFVGFGKGHDAKRSYDAQGGYVCPGLIDGHIHVLCIMLIIIKLVSTVKTYEMKKLDSDYFEEAARILGVVKCAGVFLYGKQVLTYPLYRS